MKSINRLISALPQDAEFYICILPAEDGEFRVIFNGLENDEIARALYHCADEVVRQIPLPPITANKSLN